jgi:hypothetical protein
LTFAEFLTLKNSKFRVADRIERSGLTGQKTKTAESIDTYGFEGF